VDTLKVRATNPVGSALDGGSVVAGLVALWVFGSVVVGVGGWVEGRQLGTVAPWALPGLALALLASGIATWNLLRQGRLRVLAIALGLLAAASVAMLFLINPGLAPPVP
jgi:hypothetical protein